MSDSSADAFSMTGDFSTLARAEIYTRIMLREFGQNCPGQEIEEKIEFLRTRISTESFPIVTWLNEGLIYRIIWAQPGPPHVVLKYRCRLWRSSKPDIAEAELQMLEKEWQR